MNPTKLFNIALLCRFCFRRISNYLMVAVAAALTLATMPATAATTSTQTQRVLFVVKVASKSHEVDLHIKQHMEALGYVVTMVDQDAQSSTPNGQDMIVISSTISPHGIENKYRAVQIPVLTWAPYILSELGMTESVQDVDYGHDTQVGQLYTYLVNAPHPMGAGLPIGLHKPFKDTIKTLNWGKPGLGANTIATIPGVLDRAVIFGYEKGAMMEHGFSAPARRVMFFLDDETFDLLNEEGMKLFDSALLWASGKAIEKH